MAVPKRAQARTGRRSTGRTPAPAPERTPVQQEASAASDSSFVAMRLEAARRAFPSDAEMARALGVNPSQIPRWRQGQAPDPENGDRIAGLDVVVELLSGYLSPSSIPKWLHGVNAHLGNRQPIGLLRQGRLSEVIAAIEAMKSGAYA